MKCKEKKYIFKFKKKNFNNMREKKTTKTSCFIRRIQQRSKYEKEINVENIIHSCVKKDARPGAGRQH